MTTIGGLAVDIFPIVLGGNPFGWTSDEKSSHAVLDAFVAAGGNVIDTADGYSHWAPGNSGGESETIIGSWLRRRRLDRDTLVLETKVSQHPQFPGLSADNIRRAADASLARLHTDYIDIYYAHYDDPTVPLEETVEAFDRLINAGKIRHVGISNYSAERIDEWMRIVNDEGFAPPVTLQPQYSLVHRDFEGGLVRAAEEYSLGVLPYWALGSGFLTGKYRSADEVSASARANLVSRYVSPEGFAVLDVLADVARELDVEMSTVALAWLLSKPTVAGVLASARDSTQLPALMRAPTIDLQPDQLQRLDAVSARVPKHPAE